jgi:hypothetical protein
MKTQKNRRRLPKVNHEMLEGLSMQDPWGTPRGREKI